MCKTASPCDENAVCTKTGPGTFSCKCKAGYTGNGQKCDEIDPWSVSVLSPHLLAVLLFSCWLVRLLLLLLFVVCVYDEEILSPLD
jgi:hypothetical protein